MNGIHDDTPPRPSKTRTGNRPSPMFWYVMETQSWRFIGATAAKNACRAVIPWVSEGISKPWMKNPNSARHYLSCAHRELREELGTSPLKMDFLGLINEEQTAAGRVHWGLVFQASVSAKIPHSDDLGPLRWLPPQQAANLPLEHWSHLALSLREKHHKPVTPDKRATTNLSSTRNTECPPCQKKP